MNWTELSVRRPITGVMVFLGLAILGLFNLSRLKLDMLPNLEFPLVAVFAQYPGASPESVEQLVTRPIEDAMASVQRVEDINSTSFDSVSMTLIKFAWGTDMKQADQDVRKNMELYALERLPDDVKRPMTFAFDPSMQPVLMMTVNAPGTAGSVRKLAVDEISPFLARIPGVAAADVIGGVEREIQVRLDPEWLQAYRIPAQQVVLALRGSNIVIPGGKLDQGAQELNIATRGEFTSVEQIREVVVGATAGGTLVHVGDVAEVVDSFAEQSSVVRAEGKQSVLLALRKQSDTNTVQVVKKVYAELKDLEKQLPAGVTLSPVFDQAEPITMSISNLSDSAYLATLLTALVLLVFLRSWRTSIIVMVSIPLSLLSTFTVMDFSNVTLNVISMAGLALAVGMLVDNSIVVLENIFTRLSKGEGPAEAAIDGTKEMAMPVIASTLTTVVVFAPVLFVPGLAGQLFRDMCLTIVISLMMSLVIALTLVPLMASLMVRHGHTSRFERLMAKLTWWVDPLSDQYGRFLGKAMKRRWLVIVASLVFFAGTLALYPLMGIDFMAKTDEGHTTFTVKAAPGTSLATTDALFKEVERIVEDEVPEAQVVVSRFGAGDMFGTLMGQTSSSGTVQIRLKKRAQRTRSQQDIESALRKRFEGLAGLEVRPQQIQLLGSAGDVVVKLFGDDLEKLRDHGTRVKNRLELVPGAADVTFSMEQGLPELRADLDREQIRQLGLSPAEVAATVSTYFLGTTATMYREGGDEFKVMVRAPRDVREDVNRLRALPIITPRGVTVPLQTVASIEPALGPSSVSRENQRRVATLSMVAEKIPLATLVERVEAALAELPPAPGISRSVEGTAEDLRDSFKALFIAFFVAVVLVYMVMASQFESLLEPFVILFTVPVALSGVILALVITHTTLQVTALIGVILLAGVVVNNGIVLIDVLKNKRLAGEDLVDAAVDAGRSRLRPILMTALTTIFGMVPLAFEIGEGSELWAPMARAVIGGMTVSTILTLVLVPAIYVVLAGYADRRAAKKKARQQAQLTAVASSDAAA
ncbi:MAG TPA: efflux RND transporter permease subunit [Myxococcales bacterium]|jgi:HAE1 family hydrophobic/amphiphilic exporter-1